MGIILCCIKSFYMKSTKTITYGKKSYVIVPFSCGDTKLINCFCLISAPKGHPRPKAEVDCVQHLNNQLQRHRRHRRIASMQQQRAALRRIRQLQQKVTLSLVCVPCSSLINDCLYYKAYYWLVCLTVFYIHILIFVSLD